MSETEAAFPYERQEDLHTNRTCGAACLSMVYRSFGDDVAQAQIAPAISKVNRFGSIASTTHLMAEDAVRRGFSAVAIQARHPLQALRLCRDAGIRAILNHRLTRDVATGHYTVLVDIDETNVIVHDPFFGPSRRVPHAELLELWQPRLPNSEIAGNVLIGIAAQPPAVYVCEVCRTAIPSGVECPKCHKAVGLDPAALLGCLTSACAARMWNYICCPSCDFTWTFSVQAPGVTSSGFSPDPQAAAPAENDPWNLNRVFGELDKFCSHVLSLPAAAAHPDIKKQIDFILASKEQLKLAQAEELVHRKTRDEQLARLQEETAQREAAHRQKLEELETPAPPLDGNALSRALLKSLGLPDWREDETAKLRRLDLESQS
jgi:hypothetical protein